MFVLLSNDLNWTMKCKLENKRTRLKIIMKREEEIKGLALEGHGVVDF